MKRRSTRKDGPLETLAEGENSQKETEPSSEVNIKNAESSSPKRMRKTKGKVDAEKEDGLKENPESLESTPSKRTKKNKGKVDNKEDELKENAENLEATPSKRTRKTIGTPVKSNSRSPKKQLIKAECVSPVKRGRKPKASKQLSIKSFFKSPDGKEVSPKEKREVVVENKCTKCNNTFKNSTGLKIHLKKCSADGRPAPKEGSKSAGKVSEALESVLGIDLPPAPLPSNNNNGEGNDAADSDPTQGEVSTEQAEEAVQESSGDEASPFPVPKSAKRKSKKISIKPESECNCCGEDMKTAHKTGEFQCYNCDKLFMLKASLERHHKVVHMGESHECPQCGAKCPDKGTLARHMYTHTGFKPYSCPVCKQEFSRKYHLVRHNMQTGCDGKEKPIFPCQVCGREFNRKDNLREHLRAHAGQTKRKKVFTCDSCGLDFCGTHLLQTHKRIHAAEKMFCCDFCPKRFISSGAMKKHRRTHTGERPFGCSVCSKKFAAKETLNRHVKIHTGYKPHACEYCGKRFIQSSQLKSHLFYHTGQSVFRPTEVFICELCGKTFNRRARLNEHTKFIHLGAKPFECPDCKKTFIRKEDLNRHQVIHSGVKPHKCPICSKAFAMKSSLKVHLLTHTKEPPRSCDECGRAFIRQDCLLRHMRNKHRDMLEEIRSEAEKKKLQQQLLQVAAEASLVEGLEDKGEMDEKGLVDAVSELLGLLVDEATLRGLGWPKEGVETVLESVIRRCGHDPAPSATPSHDRLRHNIKLLFTVVIDDSAIKALLNNQTIDQVILHVLRLAKS